MQDHSRFMPFPLILSQSSSWHIAHWIVPDAGFRVMLDFGPENIPTPSPIFNKPYNNMNKILIQNIRTLKLVSTTWRASLRPKARTPTPSLASSAPSGLMKQPWARTIPMWHGISTTWRLSITPKAVRRGRASLPKKLLDFFKETRPKPS